MSHSVYIHSNKSETNFAPPSPSVVGNSKTIKWDGKVKKILAGLRTQVNQKIVMHPFKLKCFLLLLLLHLYVSSAASSSLSSTSCLLQGKFHLNGMHKPGDMMLGGLFQVHFFSVFPDLSFNLEPEQLTCYGWVKQGLCKGNNSSFATLFFLLFLVS